MKTMSCPRCAGTGFYLHYGVCFRCEGRKTVPQMPVRKEKPVDPNTLPSFSISVLGTDGKWWGAESGNDKATLEARVPLYLKSHGAGRVRLTANARKAELLARAAA
jgi:hypothetical protein